MYLVQNLDQIHSLLLTNFYLYTVTDGVYFIFGYSLFFKSQLYISYFVAQTISYSIFSN
jgi:hypothetical protein